MASEIRFPNLGIVLEKVGEGFYIGNFEIRYYGVMIALGFLIRTDLILLCGKTYQRI